MGCEGGGVKATEGVTQENGRRGQAIEGLQRGAAVEGRGIGEGAQARVHLRAIPFSPLRDEVGLHESDLPRPDRLTQMGISRHV